MGPWASQHHAIPHRMGRTNSWGPPICPSIQVSSVQNPSIIAFNPGVGGRFIESIGIPSLDDNTQHVKASIIPIINKGLAATDPLPDFQRLSHPISHITMEHPPELRFPAF